MVAYNIFVGPQFSVYTWKCRANIAIPMAKLESLSNLKAFLWIVWRNQSTEELTQAWGKHAGNMHFVKSAFTLFTTNFTSKENQTFCIMKTILHVIASTNNNVTIIKHHGNFESLSYQDYSLIFVILLWLHLPYMCRYLDANICTVSHKTPINICLS